MSFEERAEFLMQSIASHDRQIGELTDGLAQTRALLNDYITESRADTVAMKADTVAMKADTVAMKADTRAMKLAISQPGTAMLALNEHSADHKSRIERLEEGRV